MTWKRWKLVSGFMLSAAVALGLAGCFGCQSPPGDFDRKIVRFIETRCHKESPCIIQLKDVTDFQWDRMYAFRYGAQQVEVEQIIGRKVPGFSELVRKLIFTRNGNIVFMAQQPTDVEKPAPKEVIFDIPDDSNYRVYGNDARFRVTRRELSDIVYFELDLVSQRAERL